MGKQPIKKGNKDKMKKNNSKGGKPMKRIKKKHIKPVPKKEIDKEEEIEIGEEDIQFFKEHGDYMSFLDSSGVLMQERGGNKISNRKKNQQKKEERKERKKDIMQDEDKMDLEDLSENGEDLELILFQKMQERIRKKKEEIAQLCSIITADPYKHVNKRISSISFNVFLQNDKR